MIAQGDEQAAAGTVPGPSRRAAAKSGRDKLQQLDDPLATQRTVCAVTLRGLPLVKDATLQASLDAANLRERLTEVRICAVPNTCVQTPRVPRGTVTCWVPRA